MPKFCGKCGGIINENGKCPKCDVAAFQSKNKTRKKLLTVVIAVVFLGIVVACLIYAIHKGFINIPFLRNNESEQQSISNEIDEDSKGGAFSPETAYSAVLKIYKDAFVNNYYLLGEGTIDEKNEYDISKVSPVINKSLGGIESPLFYCYYDISNDGVSELIISVENINGEDKHIVDMFGYENGEIKRLIGFSSFGGQLNSSVYNNGYIYVNRSGFDNVETGIYYFLEKNSTSPTEKAELTVEYSDSGKKYFVGSENNQRQITESEYNATFSKFGEEVNLKWVNLCESKLYEAEFSVRGENGINSGYQQLYVTNETKDEMTVVYCQVGETGYPVYVDRGTAFKVKKNGETTNVKWTDVSGNEFTGTISYHDDSFTLTYKTNSPDSAIKECNGADLYLKDSDSTDTSSSISTPSTTESTTMSSAVDLTPYNIWEAFVTNEWVDEDGNRLKFTQNITYYKLKPNATHTTYDDYMGTLSTTNSKGYYYGHYHIDDDKKLRFEFNHWPNGGGGLLLNEGYVWDPMLKEQNSWCMTSDGKIKFSQGNNEFSEKTYHH